MTMTESSLLAKLESLLYGANDHTPGSDGDDIFSLFQNHLRPVSNLSPVPKTRKASKSAADQQHQSLIRSLAEKYTHFLNRSLAVIPEILSGPGPDQSQSRLIETYRLCLNCLDSLSSQLSVKPYSIQLQRVRLARRLNSCAMYGDLWREGFDILERLREIDLGGKRKKKVGDGFLPDLDGVGEDKEFVVCVLEIVLMLVKCLAMVQTKEDDDYKRILRLVEETLPWFRALDANKHEKVQRKLASYLEQSALFLAAERKCFDVGLVRSFSLASLDQYVQPSLNGQAFKFAGRICSLLLSELDGWNSLFFDILTSLLECDAPDAKVKREESELKLIELISDCASKCQDKTNEFCCTFATYIETTICKKVRTPTDLILRLYAVGLYLSDAKVKGSSAIAEGQKDEAASRFLLANADRVNGLSSLLGPLERYFQIAPKENYHGQNHLHEHMECDSCLLVQHNKGTTFLLPYVKALGFLSKPLSELINAEREHILVGNEVGSAITLLCTVQETLKQFCGAWIFESRGKSSASCLQTTMNMIEQTISSHWIQLLGLQFLLRQLLNIGIFLYRNKRVKEASMALKLSCQASWTCIKRYCQEVHSSADSFVAFVNEACTRSAFYLDVLHQQGSKEVEKVILSNIRDWSVARSKFSTLPGPMPLVKKWAKFQCIEQKSSYGKNGFLNLSKPGPGKTLCELVIDSGEVSEGMLTIISEQELLAYKEMSSVCPDLCDRMKVRIIDVLLGKGYLQDDVLKKSRLLIERGVAQRTGGIESLTECIESLSSYEKTTGSHAILERHQLATAYCLRALCLNDYDQKSKGIWKDISLALQLWLGIFASDNCSADDLNEVLSEVSLPLLSAILDLLALKGSKAFHLEIAAWEIIVGLFRWKLIPLERCISYMWEYRRMSHALCFSQISTVFVDVVSKNFGEHSKFMNYWMSCVEKSKPSMVGLRSNFSLPFSAIPHGSSNPKSSIRSVNEICEVKEAVIVLLSSVPVCDRSAVSAGYILYDLSEKLISYGRLHEALQFAKESYRLRVKLLKKKFTYYADQQAEKYNEAGEVVYKYKFTLRDLRLSRSISAEVWTAKSFSFDLEDSYISPWNVLRGYLESTLQVGTIHELIGSATKAEHYFLLGKDISQSQDLAHFSVAFSAALGKLYLKKHHWNFAYDELHNANQILLHWSNDCTEKAARCRCFWLLEASTNLHLGNLIRSQFFWSKGTVCTNNLSEAKTVFTSALDKLTHLAWMYANATTVEKSAENCELKTKNTTANLLAPRKILLASEKEEKTGTKKGMKAKNVTKPPIKEYGALRSKRVTRSMSRASSQNLAPSDDAEAFPMHSLLADRADLLAEVVDAEKGELCICNNMSCWQCLCRDVARSGLVKNYIDMRWELFHRQISTRLLIGKGKCVGTTDGDHATHENFLESISNVVCGSTNNLSCIQVDLIMKEISGETLRIERAEVLCSMCWFLLKSYPRQNERKKCCDLAQVQLSQIASWLKLAFVLGHEVPILVQKVARLLAITYILSASSEPLPSSCNALSENYWAVYFHQASVGAHLNNQFSLRSFSNEVGVEGSDVTDSTSIKAEMFNLPRLAPESVKDLEDDVGRFFESLPSTVTICASILGGSYSSLLQGLFSSSARAWLLLSRMNSKEEPIILLRPLDPILEDAIDDGIGYAKMSDKTNSGNNWHCPWGSTVIDDVIPTYKQILKENYLSASDDPSEEDTQESRLSWWTRRKALDLRLNKLLRKVEDLWFGPWKYLLLGGLMNSSHLNSSHLNSVHKKLMRDLKSKCKMDANEALLKLILEGATPDFDIEAFTLELCSRKGCCIGGGITHHEKTRRDKTSTSNRSDKLLSLASQLVYQAMSELGVQEDAHREPMILVLDSDVQMLPWENLPVLRNQEVYRMPSVGSIRVTIDRCRHHQECVGKVVAAYPLLDPLDAFFLSNPGGDLPCTEMEKWFKDHKLEGISGTAPTSEELSRALQQHDLFIYVGHGSGAQYIQLHEIKKLASCASSLLMGCSSGALSLHGPYMPEGTPLAYLLAGSPVIIANLWEVTGTDIMRFGKAMLNGWLEERSKSKEVCAECRSLGKEFEAMDLDKDNHQVGKTKKLPRNKQTTPESLDCRGCCRIDRARMVSFMGRAREACKLKFLIGAAPVCYGVPTGITRND